MSSPTLDSFAPNAKHSAGRIELPELDVLRGIAAIFMVINHTGYELTTNEGSPGLFRAYVLFYTSFAPTIFFFITGVGFGIAPSTGQTNQRGLLRKVLILLAADALIWFGPERFIGLDFLGFIALSMLLLHFVRRARMPNVCALVLILLALVVRFGIGPIVSNTLSAESHPFIYFFVGNMQLPGTSYVPCPWIVYPLIGYLFGRYIRRNIQTWTADRLQLIIQLAVVGVGPLIASIFLYSKSALFYRWGSMSIAYFIASAAVIPILYVISIWLCKVDVVRNAISLRGFRSLAVVPVHYFLILLAKQFPQASYGFYFMLSIGYSCASLFIVAWLEQASTAIRPGMRNLVVWSVVLTSTLAYFCVRAGGVEATFIWDVVRYGLQVGLCMLLVAPVPWIQDVSGGASRAAGRAAV